MRTPNNKPSFALVPSLEEVNSTIQAIAAEHMYVPRSGPPSYRCILSCILILRWINVKPIYLYPLLFCLHSPSLFPFSISPLLKARAEADPATYSASTALVEQPRPEESKDPRMALAYKPPIPFGHKHIPKDKYTYVSLSLYSILQFVQFSFLLILVSLLLMRSYLPSTSAFGLNCFP